jgi:hypothetical protein
MLAQEIQDLNRDSAEDRRVKEAVIVSKTDPNRINPDDSSSSEDDEDYEDDLAVRDPELFKITESNRQIAIDTALASSPSKHSKSIRRPPELVFSDPPVLVARDDYIEVSFFYGLSEEKKSSAKIKRYMMMCDFGEEGLYALKWGVGTLLRNGDELHVASIVNIDEEVEDMNDEEKYRVWKDLDRNSKTLISKVKAILDEMLLYNIKIVTYSIAGKTRDSLLNLVGLSQKRLYILWLTLTIDL